MIATKITAFLNTNEHNNNRKNKEHMPRGERTPQCQGYHKEIQIVDRVQPENY